MTPDNETSHGLPGADGASLLQTTLTALLKHLPEHEWAKTGYPTLALLNSSLKDPLSEAELKQMFDYETIKERGRNVSALARSAKKLTPVKLDELIAMQTAKVEWLVEELLPVGAIGVLSGDPGSFKTWTLLHLADSVANGKPVFGHFPTRQAKTLIIDEENQIELIKSRMEMLEVVSGDIWFSSQFGFKVDREQDMTALQDFVKTNGIGFVMMDSFVRVNSKDENVAREIADLFEPLKHLARDGVTILLTHHHRKQPIGMRSSSSHNLRGSSDILASVDTHLAITHNKTDKRLVLDQNKSRYAKEIAPFEVTIIEDNGKVFLEYEGELRKEPFTKDQAKEGILSMLALGPQTRAELEKDLPVGKSAIATALKELTSDGLVRATVGARGLKTYALAESDPQLVIPI